MTLPLMTQRSQPLTRHRTAVPVLVGVCIALLMLAMFPLAQPAAALQTIDLGPGLRITDATVSESGAVTLTALATVGRVPTDASEIALIVDGQEVTFGLERIDEPVAVAIALDRSGSMLGTAIEQAATAARSCINGLPSGSRASLVTYADDVDLVVQATTDLAAVSAGTVDLTAAGETATFDAMTTAAFSLPPQPTDTPGSRFLVLISDGDDTASRTSRDAAIGAVVAADFAVFAVAIQTSDTNNETLDAIADATSGALIETDEAGLIGVCEEIAAQISSRFTMSWIPDNGAVASEVESTVALARRLPDGSIGPADSFLVNPATGVVQLAADVPAAIPTAIPTPTPTAAPTATPAPTGTPRPTSTPAPTSTPTPTPTAIVVPTNPTEPLGYTIASPDGWRGGLNSPWTPRAGIALAMVGLAGIFLLNRGTPRLPSISHRLGDIVTLPSAATSGTRMRILGGQLAGSIGRIMNRRGWGESLNTYLDQAGVSLRPNEYVTVALVMGVVVFGAATVLGLGIFAVAAALVAPVGIHWLVGRRGQKRAKKFQKQLVDTLVTMSGSLQSGHGLMQSIRAVSEQAQEPTSTEFARVMTESRIGRDPIQALSGVAERIGSEDFTWAVKAMTLNRELGGNLSEVLNTVADTIRERNKIADQVRVLSAEGKFSAYVLLALPFAVVAITQVLSPEYTEILYTTRAGHFVVAGSLGMMAVGAIWIKRMIKIDY